MALGFRSRLTPVLVAALAACATTPFARPAADGTPTILNVASGRTYTDCRQAFAEATGETVLRFSAGVFRCGPEIQVASDWLVIHGAGLGRTFLDSGASNSELHLSSIRPGKLLRIADLAFGGLGEQPSDDARATLVRVAITTDRPALFGTPERGVVGSVLVVHSVLAAFPGAVPDGVTMPKPLAFNGNERVGVVESVLFDVEQEYETYPAPGSFVLLDQAVQASFETHDPAAKARRNASFRPNVTCGNEKNPFVACLPATHSFDHEGPLAEAAQLLLDGHALADLEAPLRDAGKAFSQRFVATLGPAIRQPDVFWFDEPQAKVVEEASGLDAAQAEGAIAKLRAVEVVDRCGDPSRPMKTALERARGLDRLLPTPQVEAACIEKLRPRAKALLDECATGLEWDRLLEAVADAGQAMGDGGTSAKACRDKLKERATDLATKGDLTRVYLREVSRVLDLGATTAAPADRATLDAVAGLLPWIVTKTGRTLPNPAKPTVLDRLVKAALAPNAGDGRRLVEASPPCALVPLAPGAPQLKAVGKVVLAEELPNAAPGSEPRTVAELAVEATKEQLPAGTSAATLNVALIKKCEENQALAYPGAIAKYVTEELERQSAVGQQRARADAEVALFLARGAADGKDLPRPPRNVPLVRVALAKVQDELSSASAMAVQAAAAPRPTAAAPADGAPAPKGPPAWGMDDLMRAGDILSRAGLVDTDSCSFLLPDVAWAPIEGAIAGTVVLEDVATSLRCRPDPKGFELSVWVDGTPAQRVKILSALEKTLTAKLGAPTPQRTVQGPAVGWPATPKNRTAFVFRSLPPANAMLGYMLVPIGSNWTYR